MAFLDVGDGTTAAFPRTHKIHHVPVLGFDVSLSVLAEVDVLQVTRFRKHVHALTRTATERSEDVFQHRYVERAVLADEARSPLVAPMAGRNGRRAPQAMLPAHVEIRIVEHTALGIGKV